MTTSYCPQSYELLAALHDVIFNTILSCIVRAYQCQVTTSLCIPILKVPLSPFLSASRDEALDVYQRACSGSSWNFSGCVRHLTGVGDILFFTDGELSRATVPSVLFILRFPFTLFGGETT